MGNVAPQLRIHRILHRNAQSLHDHGQKLALGYVFFREEAWAPCQGFPGENTGGTHPLRRKGTAAAKGIRIGRWFCGAENGHGDGCLPGNLTLRICGRIGEGIHPNFVVFRRIGECAVLPYGHFPSAGLTGDGKGQRLPFRILGSEHTGIGKILIGLQGRILRNGWLVFLSPNTQGQAGLLQKAPFVNAQIGKGLHSVVFRPFRRIGDGIQLLPGKHIPRPQHPVSQTKRAGRWDLAQTHALQVFPKLLGPKTVNAAAVHIRSGSRHRHRQQEQQAE